MAYLAAVVIISLHCQESYAANTSVHSELAYQKSYIFLGAVFW